MFDTGVCSRHMFKIQDFDARMVELALLYVIDTSGRHESLLDTGWLPTPRTMFYTNKLIVWVT